ncbi:ATP-binding protein [Marivirga atlantica]|uniref:histidine kinase n=1 Tax=Marivirga atlantica TaxID=1548457 RepID=A0A937AMQ6_9BACT|nr:ATP-binding protein [Marivirga atlantica]MBL0766363.1 HAMP domain-containing protein [Marivirga atlantica]
MSYFIFTSERDKQNLINRMEITAKLVGEYAVSPLVFGDAEGGTEIITRLKSMPEIEEAYILDDDKDIFASYVNDSSSHEYHPFNPNNSRVEDLSIWDDAYFHILQKITYKGDDYGSIYLVVSLRPFKERLINDLRVLFINMLLIIGISWVLSVIIQQYISKPIKKLVKTTNEIVQEGNYDIRVKNQGTDEIGQLYASYNKMLERIKLEKEQQQKYSKALEVSERNYRTIFENSIVGIFNIDIKSGKLLQANERFYEILKLDPSRLEQYTIDQFLSKKERVIFLKTIEREGQIENFEINHKGDIWISFSGKRIKGQNSIDGVIQDITDRKKNYLELKKVNFELDNFVYHASHDLRSPLRSILGLTNLLKHDKPSENGIELIQRIENSILRLDNLVTDLLTFSKNSRTKRDIEEIDFKALMEESLEGVPYEYKGDIEVSVEINDKNIFKGDKTRISVIINNLLVNAHKYQSSKRDKKHIHIKIKTNKKDMQFIISDNGEGISEENQERIFDMFYRASESSDGSGLGLYIVKNVVDTLGGRIYLTSTVDKGTTFEVIIPNNQSI